MNRVPEVAYWTRCNLCGPDIIVYCLKVFQNAIFSAFGDFVSSFSVAQGPIGIMLTTCRVPKLLGACYNYCG